MAICKNCNKRGEIYGPPGAPKIAAEWKTCPSCGGRGELTGRHKVCDKCQGWAEVGTRISPSPCPKCNGRGVLFY